MTERRLLYQLSHRARVIHMNFTFLHFPFKPDNDGKNKSCVTLALNFWIGSDLSDGTQQLNSLNKCCSNYGHIFHWWQT